MALFSQHWLVFLVGWTSLTLLAGVSYLFKITKVVDTRFAFILGVSCFIFPLFDVPSTYLLLRSENHDFIGVFAALSTLASIKISSWIYGKRKHRKADTQTKVLR